MLTKSQKRYLFAIYVLGQEGKAVKTTKVAEILGVTKASTVKMAQRLIEEGCIIKEPYREIQLTPKGIKAANELYTPAVILQDFLRSKVGISEENALEDSMTIISQISDETLEKLINYSLEQMK